MINIYNAWLNLVLFLRFKKREKNTHGGVLLLVKLQALACNFTKNNTPPWMFFTFFKSCKWYQTAQSITITDKQITQ